MKTYLSQVRGKSDLDEFEEEEETQTSWYQILPNSRKENAFILRVQDFEHDAKLKELSEFLYSGISDPTLSCLHIDICSHGGSMDTFFEMWSMLTSNFDRENISTRVMSYGYSAGAFMFMMGDVRIMGECATLMFHNLSAGYNHAPANKIRASLRSDQARLIRFIETAFCLSDELTEDASKFLDNDEDKYYDVEEACVKGICTHVQLLQGGVVRAEDYIDMLVEADIQEE